jgi:hypothetical protein
MTLSRLAVALTAAAYTMPAFATPVLVTPTASHAVFVEDKGEEHRKKNAKGNGKAKHDDKKNADRSNKGGETRGQERSDQVQGMQDTGKGSGKRTK